MKTSQTNKVSRYRGSIIKLCTCTNPSQDAMYGKDMRVRNNASDKGSKPDKFRCTVCTTEREFK